MPKLRTEANNSAQDKRKKPRVILYKNDDGTWDTSSLNDEEKSRLFGGATGAPPPPPPPTPDPAAPAPEPIDPQVMGMALTMLVSIEAAVVGQKLGLDHKTVYDVLQPRPPFDGAILNLSCKVANKYGASLGPWADEIALGALLISWQVAAFNQLRQIVADQKSGSDRPAPEAPAPPPPPPPETPKKEPIPIDLLMGAHATQSGGEC